MTIVFGILRRIYSTLSFKVNIIKYNIDVFYIHNLEVGFSITQIELFIRHIKKNWLDNFRLSVAHRQKPGSQ